VIEASILERARKGKEEEREMVIDLGPMIYMALMVYAAIGISLILVLSLGTWGLTMQLKRMHERHIRLRGTRRLIRPFYHFHQQGRA